MGASKGLQQLLSLLSQCLAWAIVIGFTFLFLQHQKDGLYIFTVVGFQATLLVFTIFCRDVAGRSSFVCWSIQALTDPVLACLALTPLVLVDKVPGIMYTKECLARLDNGYTDLKCLNHTLVHPMGTWANTLLFNKPIRNHQDLDHVLDIQMIVLALALTMPATLSIVLYKPWMPWRVHILGGVFWLLQTIDCVALLEIAVMDPSYQMVVILSSLAKAVFLILTTGFVLSSPLYLVSLMRNRLFSPLRLDSESTDELPNRVIDMFGIDIKVAATYQELYIKFSVLLNLFLWEVPDIGAKALILARAHSLILPGSFFCSLVKNVLFIILSGFSLYKLFRTHPKCNLREHRPLQDQNLAHNEEGLEHAVVVVNEGQSSDVQTRENLFSKEQRWDRFVSMYGAVSCFVIVGTMIGAVCLYNI